MMRRFYIFATLLLINTLAQASSPAYVTLRTLTVASANQLAMGAMQACAEQGYQVAVAVVDRNGALLSLVRDPLAGHHTIDVASRKAYTAASFQSDTLVLQQRGMEGLRFAKDVLIIGGGVPIRVGGHFYGALGVSGAPAKAITGDVDDSCAKAGIEAVREALEFAE